METQAGTELGFTVRDRETEGDERELAAKQKFLVRTDHQALRWLFSLKEPKDRTARWIEAMTAFNFEIEYRPGQKHGNADGMSRCPGPVDCNCPEPLDVDDLKCGPCKKCLRRADTMKTYLPYPGDQDPTPTRVARVRLASSSG